jgi:hypothetical protein
LQKNPYTWYKKLHKKDIKGRLITWKDSLQFAYLF